MPHLSLRLLGPFQATLDGAPANGFRSDKVRGLLAYVCVECDRPWSRATLADLLWADFREKSARSNLRNALSNLRHVLWDRETDVPFLDISRAAVQFNDASDCWVDVRAFLDRLPEPGEEEHPLFDQQDIGRLEQALALYRGDFLEGFAVASAPFDEWMLVTRQEIRQELLRAVRLLALAHAQLGDLDASTAVTRRWLEVEPWDEAAHRHMMQLLTLRGQRSAAIAQYQACQQILSDELGIQPQLETTRLYGQIRDGRVGIPSIELPPAADWPGFESPPPSLLRSPSPGPAADEEVPLFVARDRELETLDQALSRATAGRGGVRFITGEPGSGKTALLTECARRALARHPQLLVAWGECSAFTGRGDPYFPFLNIARTLTGQGDFPVSGSAISREHGRRIWRSLPETLDALLDHGPELIDRFVSGRDLLALARLHGGVKPERLSELQSLLERLAQRPSQARVRQAALFEQFTRVLSTLAQRRPLLLMVDDAQWIDRGSVDLLFHLARDVAGRKILLLGAYRPQDPALLRGPEPHPLLGVVGELQREFGEIEIDLMQSEGRAFVSALVDSEPNQLDEAFRDLLHRCTSGNPLFTIELLRAMQLRGEIRRSPEGRWVEGPRLNWNELPARVEAVIARRIRHLSPACRELLSAASVEGEQFTAQVVADVLEEDVQRVFELLSQEAAKEHRLVTAQAVRHLDGQDLALYRFRHALFQVYLYQHLDVVQRARLHGLVAAELEARYRASLDQFPEIIHSVARHFEAAGRAGKAVDYFARAGQRAMRLSAHREALDHFYNALRLLQTLPRTPERDRQELDLQLSLGPPLTATKGWAPPEMATAYARAQELCETIDDHAQLIPALWLLATYHVGHSGHAQVDRLVERLYRLAQRAGDPALLALARLQVSPFYQGKFGEARAILELASEAPDIEQQRQLALQYGMAPAVVGLAYLSVCIWVMGFPDQADRRMHEARELAERVHHPMATCYAVSRSCWLAAMKRELEDVSRFAAALDAVAREYRIQNFVLAARFFTHWAAVQRGGPTAEGIEVMYQAIEAYRATGTVLNRTAFLTLFAQACATAGDIVRGLAALDEALALAEQTGELWFQAETLRTKGELLLLQAMEQGEGEDGLAAAETRFRRALDLAREQDARSFELRAAVSLSELCQARSEEANGLEILRAVVEQFAEGGQSLDLRRAKRLLGDE